MIYDVLIGLNEGFFVMLCGVIAEVGADLS